MARSIRWRLQAWYGLVLLAVVAGFAGVLYYRARATLFQEIDAALEDDALYLDAALRRFPPHLLDGTPPPRDPPRDFPRPRPPDRFKKDRPPPPGPSRERLMAELALPEHSASGPDGRRPAAAYFGVWRADGSVLKASELPEETAPPPPTPGGRPRLEWRGDRREATLTGPRNTRVLVGRSVSDEWAGLHAFAWRLGGAGAAVLAVGLLGGWLVSARILRPVAAIAATASSISATNLSGRIDPATVDRELAELARVLNAAFDRLEAAFERQARFTADASHELRTPLAIIRTHAELALARPRSAGEYREAVVTCLRAAERMAALVEGLLALARADAGKLDLRRDPVDLKWVVEESANLLRPLAEARGISLELKLDPAVVVGDPLRLGQVVANLLTNAVNYNRDGGSVRVELAVSSGEAVLSVADTGGGIPEEDRPHIFERFYRVDKARSRASGGTGLGLAICKSAVESHGGTIDFETESGRGTTFRVRLPCAGPDDPSPPPAAGG